MSVNKSLHANGIAYAPDADRMTALQDDPISTKSGFLKIWTKLADVWRRHPQSIIYASVTLVAGEYALFFAALVAPHNLVTRIAVFEIALTMLLTAVALTLASYRLLRFVHRALHKN